MVDVSKDGDGTLSQPSEVGAGETLLVDLLFYSLLMEDSFASILPKQYSYRRLVKGVRSYETNEEVQGAAFSTREGMEKVIENSPWLIRSVPLILNVWTPNAQVKKDEIKVVPVWVKLRHVPVVAYSEIGLSLITTQLGRPIMQIQIHLFPFLDGHRHSWKRLMLSTNGHRPNVVVTVNEEKYGFVEVKKKKKSKATKNSKQISGVRLSKPVLNYYYRRVEHGDTSKANVANDVQPTSAKQVYKEKEVVTKNSFDDLIDDDTMGMSDETNWIHAKHSLNVINESDSEEVDQVIELEQPMNMRREQTKGASTPEAMSRWFNVASWNYPD
ncbi:retrovirus-related pol polyprotein from transposon 17.6 [Tanacetum coccineum]